MRNLFIALLVSIAFMGCSKSGNFVTVSECHIISEVETNACTYGDRITYFRPNHLNPDIIDKIEICLDSTDWAIGDEYCFTISVEVR